MMPVDMNEHDPLQTCSCEKRDRKEYLRQWHLKNKERRNARTAERRRENPDLFRLRNRISRQKHRTERLEYDRKYRQEHVEQSRARCRKWYHDHLEQERERDRKKQAKYFALNRDKVLESNRKWFAKNPAYVKAGKAKRKQLMRQSAGDIKLMSEWMVKMKASRKVPCYYCGLMIRGKDIRFDHVIPLSKGGPHCVENLCCTCHSCNASKHAKMPADWKRNGQIVMNI